MNVLQVKQKGGDWKNSDKQFRILGETFPFDPLHTEIFMTTLFNLFIYLLYIIYYILLLTYVLFLFTFIIYHIHYIIFGTVYTLVPNALLKNEYMHEQEVCAICCDPAGRV